MALLNFQRLEDLGLDELANRYVAIDSQAHILLSQFAMTVFK
ncbi:MAG: hypothetical protein WCL34_10570 [Methylococcaceae bacterium]